MIDSRWNIYWKTSTSSTLNILIHEEKISLLSDKRHIFTKKKYFSIPYLFHLFFFGGTFDQFDNVISQKISFSLKIEWMFKPMIKWCFGHFKKIMMKNIYLVFFWCIVAVETFK